MTVVLAGGSGFLGSRLRAHLEAAGHQVRKPDSVATGQTALAMSPGSQTATPGSWPPTSKASTPSSIWPARTSPRRSGATARKAKLRDSRVLATRTIVRAMAACDAAAQGVDQRVGASATTVRTATKWSPSARRPGSTFSRSCAWTGSRKPAPARRQQTRLAIVRIGPGPGRRWRRAEEDDSALQARPGRDAWIGRSVHAVDSRRRLGGHGDLARSAPIARSGAFNASAPTPVTNRDFTHTLGRVLRRPAVFHAPGVRPEDWRWANWPTCCSPASASFPPRRRRWGFVLPIENSNRRFGV